MDFVKNIKEFLIFVLILLSIFVVLALFVLIAIKIDESKLDGIRFCPNCGIDLVVGR